MDYATTPPTTHALPEQNHPAASPQQHRATAQPQQRAEASPQNRATALPQHRATALPQHRATALPQYSNNFVEEVIADLVPYLDAFDPVESLLVLNELQNRLAGLEEEYQAYATWEADEVFAA